MKEHIDEMTKVLVDYTMKNHIMASHVILEDYAEELYNAGYRKQSEGEWVTKHRHRGGFRTVTVEDSFGNKHTGTLDDRWECDDLYCSVCGKIAHDAFLNYCANCGAQMKGESK